MVVDRERVDAIRRTLSSLFGWLIIKMFGLRPFTVIADPWRWTKRDLPRGKAHARRFRLTRMSKACMRVVDFARPCRRHDLIAG